MLTARGSRELRAAASAVKLARRDIANDIARATRATMNPVWRDAVSSRARRPVDAAVLGKGARIASGNPPAMVAATSTRKLSGGLVPGSDFPGWEFGADRNRVTTYSRRSRGGGTHQVTRHTSRQMPARTPKGRVVYPAVKAMGPRLAALWVSIVVRKFAEAFERGQS